MKMKVYIKNLYEIKDEKAYYRKQGIGCFDFVNYKKFASELTQEEANRVVEHSELYKKMYNADEMGIED